MKGKRNRKRATGQSSPPADRNVWPTFRIVAALFALLLLASWLAREEVQPNSVSEFPAPATPHREPHRISAAAGASASLADSLNAQLAAIESDSDPDRCSEALDRAVESIAAADLPAALDMLTRAGGSAAAVELGRLLAGRWAEADWSAAAAWAVSIPESPTRRAALGQVAIAAANTDLSAALDWLRALPESESKQAATLDLAYEAARTEPIAALNLAADLPAGAERDDLLVHAVSQWTGTDPAGAAKWVLTVSDFNLRQRLLAAVAVACASQDRAMATEVAANVLAAGDFQNRAVVGVVQRWAERSPAEAAAWLEQFPAAPVRDDAVENLLAIWTEQDRAAAENWNHLTPVR